MNFDFDAYLALSEEARDDRYPYCRVRIPGETFWGRSLGENRAILCNSPLDARYQFCDVVRLSDGDLKEVLYRPYPVRLGFLYSFTLENEKEIRGSIYKAASTPRNCVSFFWAGRGTILLRDEEGVALAIAALSPILGMRDISRLTADGENLKATTLWRNQ
jgi:hypothetical protein